LAGCLGGTLFILEVLLGTFAPTALVLAIVASVVATMVAWIGFGDVPQYLVPDLEISPSLIAWSIVAGPVFGVAAFGFRAVATAAAAHTPRGWHRVPWCVAVFFGVGLLAALGGSLSRDAVVCCAPATPARAAHSR
jgi:H+/Cl- antiporter ClcA